MADPAQTPVWPRLGEARNIDEVLARHRIIEAALPASDGVACFNALYYATTQSVAGALLAGRFEDPPLLARLDTVFGNLYFRALDAYLQSPEDAPRAWQPLLCDRLRPEVLPLQFALSGMNAHINRDLMWALFTVCNERNSPPARDSAFYRDYLLINQLLKAEEAAIKARYLPPLLGAADHAMSGLDDLLAMWSIDKARDAAWSNAETLWALRGSNAITRGYLDVIDGMVGMASRGLLRPIQLPMN